MEEDREVGGLASQADLLFFVGSGEDQGNRRYWGGEDRSPGTENGEGDASFPSIANGAEQAAPGFAKKMAFIFYVMNAGDRDNLVSTLVNHRPVIAIGTGMGGILIDQSQLRFPDTVTI